MRNVLGYHHGDNPIPARRPARRQRTWYAWVPILLSVALWSGMAWFLATHRHQIERCIWSLGL